MMILLNKMVSIPQINHVKIYQPIPTQVTPSAVRTAHVGILRETQFEGLMARLIGALAQQSDHLTEPDIHLVAIQCVGQMARGTLFPEILFEVQMG